MVGYHGGRTSKAAALLILSLTMAACSSATETTGATHPPTDKSPIVIHDPRASDLNGTLLNPPLPRPAQTLTDTNGRPFSLADPPEDELSVLFFGYTHCPDVCPTTMADLASARGLVPAGLRERITVVFVTEDPERDTPGPLRRWLNAFDPSFVGLAGGNEATKAMLKQLYLPQTKRLRQPEKPARHPDAGAPHHRHGDYGVEHAGVVYSFGPGDTTVIYSGGTKPSEYAADFIRLLHSSPGDAR